MAPAVSRFNPRGDLPLRPVPASVLIVKLAAIGDVAMALPMVTALRARDDGVPHRVAGGRRRRAAAAAPSMASTRSLVSRRRGDPRGHADAAGCRRCSPRGALLVGPALRPRADRPLRPPVQAADRPRARRERAGSATRAPRPGLRAGPLASRRVRPSRDRDRRSPRRRRWRRRGCARRSTTPSARASRRCTPGGGSRWPLAVRAMPRRDNPLRRWPLDRYAALATTLVGARRHGGRHRRPPTTTGCARHSPASRSSTRSARRRCRGSSRCTGTLRRGRCPRLGPAAPRAPRVDARRGPVRTDVAGGVPARGCAHARRCGARPRLPCAPCYDGREFADCGDNLCLQRIDVADVLARLDALLAA